MTPSRAVSFANRRRRRATTGVDRYAPFLTAVLIAGAACGDDALPIDAASQDVGEDAAGDAHLDDSAIRDAAEDGADGLFHDGGAAPWTPCPTSGPGAVQTEAACWVFTPASVGADADGVNALEFSYALEPTRAPNGQLALFLHGSGGRPAGPIASPETNVYTVLADAGYHVLSLAYRSDVSIGMLCGRDGACYGPTRHTLVLGESTAGSAIDDMRASEGIVHRLDAALAALANGRAESGWSGYRRSGETAPARVVWPSIVATGHSQGGGHAAYLGKQFPLHAVLQLSATCDGARGQAADWTRDGRWATDPATRFIGFAAEGDTTCRFYPLVWNAMGLHADHRHTDALPCDGTNAHSATVRCVENVRRLPALLALD